MSKSEALRVMVYLDHIAQAIDRIRRYVDDMTELTFLGDEKTQDAVVRNFDLSDCPDAKLRRGNPSLRIGDAGPMGRILVAGEPGNQIIAALAPQAGEIVIDKPGKGAFYATALNDMLQERAISHLMFMGVTTEVCVQTSMREANDRGYDSLLLTDCTESYFPEFKAATVAMTHAQGGIVGWTAPSALLLAALAT